MDTLTFTATIISSSSIPTGTITFKDGTTTLGTASFTNGVATYTSSGLSLGSHSISAVYGTTTNFSGSTSTTLTQLIGTASTKGTVTVSGGGTIQTVDGKFRISFPANAVSTDIILTYLELADVLHSLTGNRLSARAFVLEARTSDGTLVTQFQQPNTIVLTYADTDLSGKRIGGSSLNLDYWTEFALPERLTISTSSCLSSASSMELDQDR